MLQRVHIYVNTDIHYSGDRLGTSRIVIYLPSDIAGAIKQNYPESKSLGEAVARYILECIAGLGDIRNYSRRIREYAKSVLVAKYDGEYLDMVGR